ncbi:branched-chain amino acid transport system permease protein [Rhizobiales bacterium GAS113]|nr:branched-chain amino acid transport system permease protein [Rhizobiales bacterium GAS113]
MMTGFIQICIGGLVVGCIYALIALGFSLIYRVTSTVNLAQGGFCVLGALIDYTFSQSFGWPLAIAVPLAIAATVAIGVALGAVSFVPGLQRLSNANVLMLTVGLLTLLEGLSLVVWGNQPYALPPFSDDHPVKVGSILVPTQAFWVGGTTVVLITALWLFIAKTRMGRALRACADNPTAASLVGIGVPRMTLFSFGLATFIAAVAGVVIAPTTTLQFDTGRLFTISGFIAVVIGGISSFPGAIAGGLLLGLTTQLATAYVSSLFSNAIALSLLLAVLIWRPSGLIRSSVVRRQDVRDEARVWGHVVRLRPHVAWIASAVALAIAAAVPLFISSGGVMTGLTIAAILFIALIGLDILMGYAGQISLGQAGFMAIGGYTSGYLTVNCELSSLASIAVGILLSLACALFLSLVTLRLRGLYLALATLAFGLLIDSCAIGFIDFTGGPSGMVGIPSFAIGTFEFASPRQMYYVALTVDVVLLLTCFGGLKSGFGRALRAIRTDQMAAAALGINTVRYKLIAFMISAGLASLSGSLLAFFFNFLSPDMVGTNRSLELVSMLVIGGEGTLVGAFLGSVLLTLLPTLFQPFAIFKTLVSGGLLVTCFLYLPQGLYGVLCARLARLSRPDASKRQSSKFLGSPVP